MEEISLREYIEVLLKWKWLIILLTVVAMLTSGVISFFFLPSQYEATATLLVNEPKVSLKNVGNSALDLLVESLSQSILMSMETYKHQIKNPVLLKQVRDELGLDPEQYSIERLARSITVEHPKDTTLLRISVINHDPNMAKDIANTLARQFVEFIDRHSRNKLVQSTDVLKAKVEAEEQKLVEAQAEYAQFLAETRGVEELQQEQAAKISLLTAFKSQMVTKDLELASLKKALEIAREQLKDTPAVLVTNKSLSDDPYLQAVARDKLNSDTEQLSGITMKSEEVNPVYVSLQQKINDLNVSIAQLETEREGLARAIEQTSTQLESLQVELAEKKALEDKLLAKIHDLKANYDLLSQKYEEARIASTVDTGATQISLIAPALEPKFPVKPNKKLNVAVAGVLGIMVSVFLAFFVEYWINSAPTAQTPKEHAKTETS